LKGGAKKSKSTLKRKSKKSKKAKSPKRKYKK
jgi:hypothetical protein